MEPVNIVEVLASWGLAISDTAKFVDTLESLAKEQMMRMMLKSQGIDVKAILTQVRTQLV